MLCLLNSLFLIFSKILAGKSAGGVTITPAQPRVLPVGVSNLGYGVSISRTTGVGHKAGGLPSSTTMTSLGSGFAASRPGGLGYASLSSSHAVAAAAAAAKVEKQPVSQIH
jgi:hypothetical protein